MDRLVKRFDCERDSDLRICPARGVAYQKDMTTGRVPYDAAYLAKVEAYEGSEIARAVNAGRCALLRRHLPVGMRVLDIGAGSGAFMRAAMESGYYPRGLDAIEEANKQLRAVGLYAEDPHDFDAVTMWDAIEHMEDPEHYLRAIRKGAHLFVSIPVFDDLRAIRASKHYRPGEHLYYWTAAGFIDWMGLYGFRLLEQSAHETAAGRESIGAFAFCRDLPDYHDHVAAYRDMHVSRFYGSSATELHLGAVAEIVARFRPTSILDYGCGRSDLVAHFWNDGRRRIARYDPAIAQLKKLPDGRFDMVFCCDVMEHVPMASVDQVINEIRTKSSRVIFTISTKLARAKLPDGRNAHVTLLTREEWGRWLADYFGEVTVIPTKWEHELLVVAGPQS